MGAECNVQYTNLTYLRPEFAYCLASSYKTPQIKPHLKHFRKGIAKLKKNISFSSNISKRRNACHVRFMFVRPRLRSSCERVKSIKNSPIAPCFATPLYNRDLPTRRDRYQVIDSFLLLLCMGLYFVRINQMYL